MKYSVHLFRSETKDIPVMATNRDEALKVARENNPQFQAEDVTEIGEDGKPGETHSATGSCENCDKIIWEGDKYVTPADDVTLCVPCCESLRGACGFEMDKLPFLP